MKQIPNIEEEKGMELILEVLPHLILGNAEELYNNPDGEMAKNTISEMQRVIRETHHHQLQKAHQDWLREEIVKLKEAKLWEYNFQGKRSMAFKNYNQALQTIIDRYHSELDQDPVHDFFTAPEEVKRPVYERALAKTQEEQEKKLDQPTVKCGHHQAMLEGAAVGLDQDGKCIDCGAEVLRTDTNK